MTDAVHCNTDMNQHAVRRVALPARAAWRWAGFIGPAALVSVGYMDPGNWATDLEGGARFGYQLLWVLVASNLIAMLLQTLAVRLGIGGQLDLAQACRSHYGRPTVLALWLLCEIAIIACDLGSLLGSAIALNLLFGIPLGWGALVTGADVLVVIALQRYGIRKLEAFVGLMILTVAACMTLQLGLAQPVWGDVAGGLVPRLDTASLFVAMGILGATVMPHNLYLHSALVQTRQVAATDAARREAIRYNLFDTAAALNVALLINGAILVLSASTFFVRGIEVTELRQAHSLLTPILGTTLGATAFAIALLASGQTSTVTGTIAGQVVMEGFLRLRMGMTGRRLLTRALAIVPAVAVLFHSGEDGALHLLVATQVVLSLQLPFAIVPLLRFTSEPAIMGPFVSSRWIRLLGRACALLVIGLNAWLVVEMLGSSGLPLRVAVGAVAVGCAVLLAWVSLVPLRLGPALSTDDGFAHNRRGERHRSKQLRAGRAIGRCIKTRNGER